MSGYAALVRFDGAPIDAAFIDSLADSIRFRGPDGEGKWIGAQAAMVHSLMATNDIAKRERQPLRRGEIVIAGDIRIDGRDPHDRRTDSELVLDAYETWGESFLEHLIGDFSFAIWDGAKRQLLCARDRFGRRPLFVGRLDRALLVTNNLPTVLDIPQLAAELDDAAITD